MLQSNRAHPWSGTNRTHRDRNNTETAYILSTQRSLRPHNHRRYCQPIATVLEPNQLDEVFLMTLEYQSACSLDVIGDMNVLRMVTTLWSVWPGGLQYRRSMAEWFSDSEVTCRQLQQRQWLHHADNSCVCCQTRLMPSHCPVTRHWHVDCLHTVQHNVHTVTWQILP